MRPQCMNKEVQIAGFTKSRESRRFSLVTGSITGYVHLVVGLFASLSELKDQTGGMAMRILSLLIILFSVVCFSTAEAGYKRDPWGSMTWEGPGRPPHWSAPTTGKTRGTRDSINKRRDDRQDTSRRYDGGFRDRKKSRDIIIYSQQKDEPVVIRHRTIIKNRYVPVSRGFSPRSCGGDNVYLRKGDTNELIILYVSPAENC